ncbi:hypothetical protein RRL34_004259 [Vibrio parahaemolyticus]|nr:hypothetical protein [Vibrio parahaemolyticus]
MKLQTLVKGILETHFADVDLTDYDLSESDMFADMLADSLGLDSASLAARIITEEALKYV